MPKFRKKPVVVEAVHYTGDNLTEVEAFVGESAAVNDGDLNILTLEGRMRASVGDWIIKGTSGEFYPCKPEIFSDIYEEEE